MHPHARSRTRHAIVLLSIVLTTALGVIVTATSGGVAQTTKLRLVSTPWPPFTNSAEPRFALDLIEEALSRVGVMSSTTIVPPARFTAALMSASYDGSGAAWKDAQRESTLLFSQEYLENRLILVGRKGTNVAALNLAALRGKRIAIVDGYSYGDIEASGAVFVRVESEEECVSRLLDNDVEYVLMDDLVVQYIVNNYATEAQTKLAFGSGPIVTRSLYLAIHRSLPDADSIISRFNTQLRKMIADRTYHKLLHVSWIVADVNGDGVLEYVPENDQAGPAPPKSAYSLFTERPSNEPNVPSMNKPGFYVGGTIYPDWAAVPDKYKIPPSAVKPEDQDPSRHTASVWKFVWK
jgi:polar amino acid transport system substrate-binding protein